MRNKQSIVSVLFLAAINIKNKEEGSIRVWFALFKYYSAGKQTCTIVWVIMAVFLR